MPTMYHKKWSAHLILRPIPPHQTRPLGPRRVILPWTTKGNCRWLSVSMIFSLVKSLLKPLLKSRSKFPGKILSEILSKTYVTPFVKFLVKSLEKSLIKITACTCELLDPKIEKSPTYGASESFDHPPPTWHQIWNPIRMLVTIFENVYK